MRRLVALAVLAAALPAHAQEGATTTTTTPPAEVKATTEVLGDVPASFAGRWMAVNQAKLPNGQLRPFVRLFAIERRDGKLALDIGPSELPPEVAKRMEEAGVAGRRWEPTPEDVQATASHWGTAGGPRPDHSAIDVKLYAASVYPPELKNDDITKDSPYAIMVNETFTGANRVMRTLTIWGIDQVEPASMKGDMITTTIAAAPLPIPITLRGESTIYRLSGEAAGERSFLQRLLDFFSGCGR